MKPPSSSVSSLSSRREAKRTRRYVMLLAFVSFLAPLVYHRTMSRTCKRSEERAEYHLAHHHFSSLHDQHRTSIITDTWVKSKTTTKMMLLRTIIEMMREFFSFFFFSFQLQQERDCREQQVPRLNVARQG